MAQPATDNNVLKTLDDQKPTAFYWQLTLLATLGGFLFGYDTSNIGSALNFVPYHLHGLALGYLVSGASLGAAAGAILGGPASDHFGRKLLLILDAGIYAVGAIMSAVTPNAAVLLIARTLIGMAIGADSAVATAYIAEYAPKDRRGSLTMLQQWMITVGILVSYIVALIIFSAFPASAATVGWRLVLGLGAVPALVGLALRTRMPESPRWLLRHGRYDDVRKAMATLGVQDVSQDDVRRAAEIVERVEGGSHQQRRRAWTPGVRRALVVVCVFFIFQQITGINVPLYYGPHLLGPIFSGAHASLVQTTIAGVEVTAIMTSVNVAATYLGFRWIDKFGRKPLAIGGYTGMIVFALVTAGGSDPHVRHAAARGHHDRPGLLHRLVRGRRRRRRLDPAGRGVPHRGPRSGRGLRRDDRLAGQLCPHRGLPGDAERHQPVRRHGRLRRPVRAGHRVRLEVPARDQEPAGRGDRPGLRAAAARRAHCSRRPEAPDNREALTGAGLRSGPGCRSCSGWPG